MTLLVHHPACVEHDTGPDHPESVRRLHAILAALDESFPKLPRAEAPRVTRDQLSRVHPEAYIDAILKQVPESGRVSLDPDTWMSPGTGEAALRSAGAAAFAVQAVLTGEHDTAFCATRPPGHHAEPARAMGFCFFNNIAVAAREAQANGMQRVAILDFDVHHGNGTQAVFWSDPDVLFASTHQHPCYPWTGSREETGVGNIINRPLAAGSGSEVFRTAWNGILEAVTTFRPEMVLVSAGFDGHRLDPLADMNLETGDFAWISGRIRDLARECCGGRAVSLLEGGYDLEALTDSVVAHVTALAA